MSSLEFNPFQQPLGPIVKDWNPPPLPASVPMIGDYCRIEPLDPTRHASTLYAAFQLDELGSDWTYLPYGPFDAFDSFRDWLQQQSTGIDPLFYAVIDKSTEDATGVASYLRITPASGSIEVGHIHFSPMLRRTRAATEAMYLMMAYAFQSGYRRYEWKCDALNGPSRVAAERLGFSFEGIFRQATIVKGRNRDTAWYSVIDRDWPALNKAFLRWLDRANFDESGRQRVSLSTLTHPIRKAALSVFQT